MNRFENMHPGLDIAHIDNADQRLWHRLERVQMLSGRLLRAEGGRLSLGRGAGSAEGAGPRFKRRNEQFPALAGEPAGADDAHVGCDRNCRSCPLRGTASCIKRH